ncbi:carboxylesterase/lipase family protein [Micromonospora sediminimaris]|uniref:carboxylesterase/lipase family protein n=1 Tax=Micromonospora sediminimaris TaxID=547162 RepID=UPI00379113A7
MATFHRAAATTGTPLPHTVEAEHFVSPKSRTSPTTSGVNRRALLAAALVLPMATSSGRPAAAVPNSRSLTDPIVRTTCGKLEGSKEAGLFVFRGVPYAEPPVGDRRWLPPEPKKRWQGVRPAKAFGAVAPQHGKPPTEFSAAYLTVPGERSEDCLFLNVWTPGLDRACRPIMFWIHGGGYEYGSGGQPNYDGSSLARRGDVVVVTVNFRLGALGYLSLSEVTGGRIPSTGNEGRLDLIAALQWVRENARSFGGDPDNITVFGQSAGSVDCTFLMASPPAKGLFRRVILQSGAGHTAQTVERARLIAEIYLKSLNIRPSDVEAIRALTPQRMVEASSAIVQHMAEVDPHLGAMHYLPVIDGVNLLERPIDAIRNGASSDVSLLAGSQLDEHRLAMGHGALPPMSEEQLVQRLRILIPTEHVQPLIDTYRPLLAARGNGWTSPLDLHMAIEGDRAVRVPTLRIVEAKQQHRVPAHHYLGIYPAPILDGLLGCCHALDLGLVFGTYDQRFNGTGSAIDALSARIQDAWLAFARTGNPSNSQTGRWPTYGARRQTMLLDYRPQLVDDPYPLQRLAWENFPDEKLGLL